MIQRLSFLVILVAIALPLPAQQRVITTSNGSVVVLDGGNIELGAPPAAPATSSKDGDEEEGEPTPREEKLKKLEFNRRPSAILEAWANPPKK